MSKISEEEKQRKLAYLHTLPAKSARTNIKDLPRWVKIAIARKEILGYTWAECLEDIDRSPSTLADWRASPAAHEYRAHLHELAEDPVALGAMILRADTANVAIDYLAAIEAAKRAGDYREVRMGLKDLLKTQNLIKDSDMRRDAGVMTINVTLGGGQLLDAPEIVSSYSILEAEIVEDD